MNTVYIHILSFSFKLFNLNPGIHAHIDRRMRAATTAMKQAEQQLPKKKRNSVWFSDISPQLTKLHTEVKKVEQQCRRHDITGQRRKRLLNVDLFPLFSSAIAASTDGFAPLSASALL